MTDFKDVDEALADLQSVLPVIKKATTGNVGGRATKYADLADVCREVLPLTSARGLAWVTRPTLTRWEDGTRELVLYYSLRHAASGTSIDGEYPLGTGGPQQLGSAITYARRYTFCAVTGVVADEDDDGRAAEQGATATRKRESPPRRGKDELPRNTDGSVSRSRTTDDELAATGQMTDAQIREHGRLERDVKGTGPQGTERLTETPADDPWYQGSPYHLEPAGMVQGPPPAVRTPRPAGNIAGVIHREFARLGFTDEQRPARLRVMSTITGREITSTNDLSAVEALEVKRVVQACKDQGVLAARLLERQQEAPDA